MLFDTHCHVHFNAFKGDMDDVVRNALANDVSMITVGTRQDTSENAVAVAERYRRVWAAVGLHPSHLFSGYTDKQEIASSSSKRETFDPEYYRKLLAHPKVVAVGEMGLDYYHNHDGFDPEKQKELQVALFTAGAKLAKENGLPIIVHCRNAHDDQIELLTKIYGPYISGDPFRGVIHCFTGTSHDAQRYFDLGFFIGFTGIITFPPRKSALANGEELLTDVVRWAPLERILVETDAPYLAPVPYRGKRCLPRYVREVAKKVAELKGIDPSEVEARTTENTFRLFQKIHSGSR